MPEVWKVSLARERSRIEWHEQRLKPEERERAARFRFEADRLRHIVARSTRNEILGLRLGVDPSTLVFENDRFGKPRLRQGRMHRRLHFNSSHSGDWILHAFDDDDLGVDVELVRPQMASLEDFAWVLSPEERAFVLAHDASSRADAMATVWVRKEAYVKALGAGLQRELTGIGIVCGNDGLPTLGFDLGAGAERAPRWHFVDIEVDVSHRACVVHRATHRSVVLLDYAMAGTRIAGSARHGNRTLPL